MTFAEFLCLLDEYEIDVEEPERFRFMLKNADRDEMIRLLQEVNTPKQVSWSRDIGNDSRTTDGQGNVWRRAKSSDD